MGTADFCRFRLCSEIVFIRRVLLWVGKFTTSQWRQPVTGWGRRRCWTTVVPMLEAASQCYRSAHLFLLFWHLRAWYSVNLELAAYWSSNQIILIKSNLFSKLNCFSSSKCFGPVEQMREEGSKRKTLDSVILLLIVWSSASSDYTCML